MAPSHLAQMRVIEYGQLLLYSQADLVHQTIAGGSTIRRILDHDDMAEENIWRWRERRRFPILAIVNVLY